MKSRQKYFATCLVATAALLASIAPSFATGTPTLRTVSEFTVLGGTNVTCTAGSVVGSIGVAPGSAVSFTNTGCTITGATPPATDAAAVQARADFLASYAALRAQTQSCTWVMGTLAGANLAPGVYCLDAVAKTGLLTLTGPADGVWTFLVEGALTGTDFTVAMAGGGQACNVSWAPSAAATLTTSSFKGNLLAGNATDGAITLTGGTLAGRALANVAVTMTNASVIGCSALAPTAPIACPVKKHHDHDGKHGKHDKNKHHKQKGHDRD